MSEDPRVAAIDLGATSGRVMLATVRTDRLELTAAKRFPNRPLSLPDGMHWDIPALYRGALEGLARCHEADGGIRAIGVDSWALDYGLIRGRSLLGLPFHYRDRRSHAGVDRVHSRISPADLFQRNGLQHLHFNTLYQLSAEERDGMLESADSMLMIPDLISYWLTDELASERTNASTTGLLSAATGQWDRQLAEQIGIRPEILGPLVDPGMILGPLRASVREEIGGGKETQVVHVGSHDTASAVLAVPLVDPSAAYISCGTWALVGQELAAPVLTEQARSANFTNERGIDGSIRFLTNVMGLWILSETLRTWERAGEAVALDDILRAAADVRSEVPVFDVSDPMFQEPGDMPTLIIGWFRRQGRAAPHDRAALVRSILESLAEAFAQTVRTAGTLSGRPAPAIHIVGGGALNELLCQLTSDRSGLPVFAGPVEATALGNALVQARSVGLVDGDADALREIARTSASVHRYDPRSR